MKNNLQLAIRFLVLFSVFLSAGPLGTQVCLAQSTPTDKAKQHSKIGIGYVDQGRFLEAVTEFKKAYKYDPKPKYVFNVARAYHVMGKFRMALESYRRFKGLTSSEKKMKTAQTFIEEVTRQLSTLRIEVDVEIEEVVLVVDGDQKLCTVNYGCLLDPGDHNIAVTAPGYASVERKIRIDAGETLTEPITLVVDVKGLPTRKGSVWRSVAFPGMGQYYAGKTGPGTVFLVTEVLLIGGAAGGFIGWEVYKYRRDQDSGENWDNWAPYIANAYWVGLSSSIAAGVVWAINIVHSAAMPLPTSRKKNAWFIHPIAGPGANGVGFTLAW